LSIADCLVANLQSEICILQSRRFSEIYIQEVSTTSGFVLLIVLEVIPLNLPSSGSCRTTG
jgi:hypothetical protein